MGEYMASDRTRRAACRWRTAVALLALVAPLAVQARTDDDLARAIEALCAGLTVPDAAHASPSATWHDLLWPADPPPAGLVPANAVAQSCADARGPKDPRARSIAALDAAQEAMNLAPERQRAAAALAVVIVAEGQDAHAPAWARALVGVAHGVQGTYAFTRDDVPAEAREFALSRQALLSEHQQDTPFFAQMLTGAADGERRQGHLDEASRLLGEARSLLVRLGRARGSMMTDVLNQATLIATARGDFAGQVELAREEIALDDAIAAHDNPDGLEAWASLVGALRQLGRYDEALVAYRHARAIIARQPAGFEHEQPSYVFGVLENGTLLYLERGDGRTCLALADDAIAIARAAFQEDGPGRLLVPLLNRASCQRELGQYLAARATLEEATGIAVGATSAWIERRIHCQVALAELLLEMGDVEGARAAARSAVAVSDGPDLAFWRGRAYRVLALQEAAAGDWSGADGDADRAATLLVPRLSAAHPMVLALLATRCEAYGRGGSAAHACDALDAALPALIAAGSPDALFQALSTLARHAERQGLVANARELRLRAVAASAAADGPSPLWIALDDLARQLRTHPIAARDRAMAVFLDKQAVLLLDRMREQFQGDRSDGDRLFVADKVQTYRRLAGWLAEDGRLDEAIDVLRRLKREEYTEFVHGDIALRGVRAVATQPGLVDESEAALGARWTRLRNALRVARSGTRELKLERAPAPAQKVPGAGKPSAAAVAADAQRLSEVRRFVDASPMAPPHAGPRKDARMPASIPPGRLDVWFVASDEAITEVLQTGDRRSSVRLPVDASTLNVEVSELLRAMIAREPVEPQLQRLYAQLGAPLDRAAGAGGASRVRLHVDGALRYLPFAALYDGRDYLGARLAFDSEIDTAGPGSVPTAPGAAPRVTALGVTRGFAGVTPLPRVADEICGILQGPVHGLPTDHPNCTSTRGPHGEAWLNEGFTQGRLATLLAAPTSSGDATPAPSALLHIATHFVLRPGVMSQSWLLLGDGNRLHLQDVAKLDLSRESLVTLSACETALGGQADGREVDGLGGLLIRRGAHSVIASLWPVEDRSTAALMLSLYRQFADTGVDASVALQRAQRALLATPRVAGSPDWRHPFYWAGFVTMTRPTDATAGPTAPTKEALKSGNLRAVDAF